MGQFLTAWIEFERLVRDLTPSSLKERGPVIPTARISASLFDLDSDTRSRFERLRRMRNHLVHGIEIPNADDLREAARESGTIREATAQQGSEGGCGRVMRGR